MKSSNEWYLDFKFKISASWVLIFFTQLLKSSILSKLVIFGKTGNFYSDSGLKSSEINPEKYTEKYRPQNQQIIN